MRVAAVDSAASFKAIAKLPVGLWTSVAWLSLPYDLVRDRQQKAWVLTMPKASLAMRRAIKAIMMQDNAQRRFQVV